MDTYFNRSPQEALEAIGSTSGGLTTGKAEEKLKEYESIIGKDQIKKELESILEERDITNLKKRITKIIEK